MFPTPFNSSMKLWYNLSNKHSWYTSWTFNPLSVSVFVAYISCKQNIIGSITFHNNKHNVLDTHIITFVGDVSWSEPPHHCRHLRPCPQSPVSSGPAQNRNIAGAGHITHYSPLSPSCGHTTFVSIEWQWVVRELVVVREPSSSILIWYFRIAATAAFTLHLLSIFKIFAHLNVLFPPEIGIYLSIKLIDIWYT